MWKKIFLVGCLFMILPFQSFADTVKYAHANAPIQKSNTSSMVIERIPGGAEVKILGEYGEFYKIQYKDKIGYTGKNNLRDSMGYEEWNSNLSPNSTFLDVARERKRYVKENGYTYTQDTSILRCPLDATYGRGVDCSTFVCDVLNNYGRLRGYSGLYQMGRFSTRTFGEIGNSLLGNRQCVVRGCELTQYFSLVPETKKQPGDIVLFSGHVEIYAGNGMVYSCGSKSSIQAEGLLTYMDSRPIVYVLRVK